MKIMSRWIGMVAAAAACSAALLAQTPALNVKLGLWETTSTTKVGGDMPGLDTSKLPPEQRAQVEAAMKQLSRPQTSTNKSCMTQEDLQKATFLGKDGPNCKTTVTKNTATMIEAHRVCTGGEASTQDLHVEATSSTAVNGTFKATTTARGKTMNVDGTIAGHWLSADCGEVK